MLGHENNALELKYVCVCVCSGTPDECLTPLVSHALDDLQFIDSGLGGQVRISLPFFFI